MWIPTTLVWLLSWLLPFRVEGGLNWEVIEKITDYGQNLTLFCEVNNCCTEQSGWLMESQTIYIDVRNLTDVPDNKYGAYVGTNGFGLVIRKLDEKDINVTYECSYGFDLSGPKLLQFDDVFVERTTGLTNDLSFTTTTTIDDNKSLIIGSTVGTVLGVIVVVVVFISVVYWRRSCNRSKHNELGNVELMPLNYQPQDETGTTTDNFVDRISQIGLDALATDKVVLVTGMVGSGKSEVLRNISELYCKENGFKELDLSWQTRNMKKTNVNYFANNEKLNLYGDNLLVLMDDFTSNGSNIYFIQDFDFLSMVHKTKCEKPENVKIVLSVVDSCFEHCKTELKNRKVFSDVVFINLNDDQFEMTDSERVHLLKTHLPENYSKPGHYSTILKTFEKTEEKIGLPELCYLFSNIPDLKDKGELFFHRPSSLLTEYIQGLKNGESNEDRVLYAVFIHIMISHNLPIFGLNDPNNHCMNNMKEIIRLLYHECISIEDLENIIDRRDRGLLIKTSEDRYGCYIFQTRLISYIMFDIEMHQIGFENMLGILSLEFIVECLRPHTSLKSEGCTYTLVLEENFYQVVSKRIINLIIENKRRSITGQESVQKLCLSPLLHEERFLQTLLTSANNPDLYKYSDLLKEHISGFHGKFGHVTFHLSAVLLQSAVEHHLDTKIVKNILNHISETLKSDPPPGRKILEACHGTLIFALIEECKGNELSRLNMFLDFIRDHGIDYKCNLGNKFLSNACGYYNKDTVRWILDNIDLIDDNVYNILELHGDRFIDGGNTEDNFKWIIEEIYSDEPSERNELHLFKAVEYLCQRMTRLNKVVKYLWQTYEQKILKSYCKCFPSTDTKHVRFGVLNIFMDASLKALSFDLISWWIDKEGFQNFDTKYRKEIKEKFRIFGYKIPDHWKFS